jgi:hypothetical protein
MRAEFVYHPFFWETEPGTWQINPAADLQHAQVTTGSVLYLSWFNRIPWDAKSYLFHEPNDWNRFRKLKYLGVRAARHPEPLLRHYLERNQPI